MPYDNLNFGYRLGIAIGSSVGLALFITNAIEYDKIRRSSCNAISSETADRLFWLNVILAIVFTIIVLFTFYKLLTKSQRYSIRSTTAKQISPPEGSAGRA